MVHPAISKEYEWGLAQYLGAGVAACYRGYRVYDTERTRRLVMKYVEFFKASLDEWEGEKTLSTPLTITVHALCGVWDMWYGTVLVDIKIWVMKWDI